MGDTVCKLIKGDSLFCSSSQGSTFSVTIVLLQRPIRKKSWDDLRDDPSSHSRLPSSVSAAIIQESP